MKMDINAGRLAIGGCMPELGAPDWKCSKCGLEMRLHNDEVDLQRPERVIRVITESSWGMPEECKPMRTDLMKYNEDQYYCEYSELDEAGSIISRKTDVDKNSVIRVLQRISKLNIPAVPSFEIMGCDGGFTELHIGDYSGAANYRWWSVPPKGWEGLDEVALEVLSWRKKETI